MLPNLSKAKESYLSFYNGKFPSFLQGDFHTDAKVLWQEIENELFDAAKPGAPDCDKLQALCSKLEVFLPIYKPSQQQREMVATVLLRVLLEEKLTNHIKVMLMGQIYSLLGNAKDLQVNWKSIQAFLNEMYFKTGSSITYARGMGIMDKIHSKLNKFVKKMKSYYPEESVPEVMKEMRQCISPFFESVAKGALTLILFLNSNKKFSKAAYEKIIPELFEIWSWKTSLLWDRTMLTLLTKIARDHPSIDWTPYHNKLFTNFFKNIKNEFPKKDATHIENVVEINAKQLPFMPKGSNISSIAEFLVILIKPKNHPYSPTFWDSFDRLHRAILPFIHPENPGAFSKKLAKFYDSFSEYYIKRANKERNIKKKQTSDGKIVDEKDEKAQQEEEEEEEEDYKVEEFDEPADPEERDKREEPEEEEEEEEEEVEAPQADQVANFLDEETHERFFEMIIYVLKNLLYSRDDSVTDSAARMCRRLLFWQPEKFAPMLLQMLYEFLSRTDLTHFGFLKVLTQSIYPLISRTNYKQGLYQIPKLLDITLEHLTTHDLKKTGILLDCYEEILGLVPLFHPNDLRAKHQELFGTNSDYEIKQKLNKDEDEDLWKLTEELSDWATTFFKKFIGILEFVDKREANLTPKLRSLMLSYSKFHNYICGSSPTLVSRYIEILANYIEENTQKIPNKYLSDVIIPLNLTAPDLTTKRFIPMLKSRILSKTNKRPDEYKTKRPLEALVEQSNVKDVFDQYELKLVSKESLLWYLNILNDVVKYSSPAILEYTEDIEIILYHALLHEEHVIFDKACQIFQDLILSTLTVYPTDLGPFSPAEFSKENFNFYKKIGRTFRKQLKLTWHEPSEKEINYARDLYTHLFDNNLAYISSQYLQNSQLNVLNYQTVSRLVDSMHLRGQETSSTSKQELGRSLILAHYVFLAVSQRATMKGIIQENEIRNRFENKVMISHFNDSRVKAFHFARTVLQYSALNGLLVDPWVGTGLVVLLSAVIGEDDQILLLQANKRVLGRFARRHQMYNTKEKFQNRYLQALDVSIEFQKRMISYDRIVKFNDTLAELPLMLWVLTYHTNETVGAAAQGLLMKFHNYLDIPQRKQVEETLCAFATQFVQERFTFLNQVGKQLDESGSVKFGDYEVIKNNKESYIDLIIRGAVRNIEFLFPYLSTKLDHLFILIENLMNSPKKDDQHAIGRFWRIARGIDLSAYLEKKEDEDDREMKKAIIKSNALYTEFEQKVIQTQYERKPFYDKKQILPVVEAQMLKLLIGMSLENMHWKVKIVAGIFSMILADILPSDSPLLAQLLARTFDQVSSEHNYLRVFGVACFSRLLKRVVENKKEENYVKKKPEDFKGLKLTIDEVFDRHFLLKEDLDKHFIKDSYVGFLEYYDKLRINNLKNPDVTFPKDLLEKIHDAEFLNKVILNMVNDIPTKEESSGGAVGRAAFNFKSIIKYFFGKQSKGLSAAGFTDFSMTDAIFFTTLLRYFDGPKIVDNTINTIKELAKEYNSREKQIVSAHYFYSIIRAFKYWDNNVIDKYLGYAADLLNDAFENCSFENVLTWITALIGGISKTDSRITRPFINKILINPLEKKSSAIQARFLAIHSSMVKEYGPIGKEIAENLAQILLNFKPGDMRQGSEIPHNLMALIKYYILNPVNYQRIKEENIVENIDSIIKANPKQYVVEGGVHLYKINHHFCQLFENYTAWIKSAPTPEEKKIYFELLFNYINNFQFDRLNYPYFIYFKSVVQFFLEMNIDELALSPETIQVHEQTLLYLSKLEYPEQAIPEVIEIIKNCLSSPSYRVRENALKFYHFFYYNHVFYLKEVSPELVLATLGDESVVVRNRGFDVAVDILKLLNTNEVAQVIKEARTLVETNGKKKEDKDLSKSLLVMMAVVLSYPYEIEEWTEDVLSSLLNTKRQSKIANEKFNKDFVHKFWDYHKGLANIKQRSLSYEIYSEMKQVGTPSSYFA